MRFLGLAGLYNKPVGAGSLKSGVYWNTQPSDIPYNAQVYEQGSIYEFVRMSGTCTVGSFVYLTGTSGYDVCCSGTGGVRPMGVMMVSPTTSGAYTFIQKYGKNTSIQITSTFSISFPSHGMFVDGGSAAINQSAAVSGALIGSAGVGLFTYVGQAVTAATGSQCVGFINLL